MAPCRRVMYSLADDRRALTTAEWNSGDRDNGISWTSTAGTNSVVHAITLDVQAPFTENNNQAEWGTMYHVGQAVRRFISFSSLWIILMNSHIM